MRLLLLLFAGLGVLIWADDSLNFDGERTVYTVECVDGVWNRLSCSGRVGAGQRYHFKASRSRNEVVFGIVGSYNSGRYTDCLVTDSDNWMCTAHSGDEPSIAYDFSNGRPAQVGSRNVLPFRAVAKWKWWVSRAGYPVLHDADYGYGAIPPPREILKAERKGG